jgi:hypothetical protein
LECANGPVGSGTELAIRSNPELCLKKDNGLTAVTLPKHDSARRYRSHRAATLGACHDPLDVLPELHQIEGWVNLTTSGSCVFLVPHSHDIIKAEVKKDSSYASLVSIHLGIGPGIGPIARVLGFDADKG